MKTMQTERMPGLVQSTQYLFISEAATTLGVSARSIYSYIRSGKLGGERIGQTIVVRRDALEGWQPRAAGRPRMRTPIWRTPVASNLQYVITIQVRVQAGQEQRLKEKVGEVRTAQQHLFSGTTARCIVQQTGEPAQIQLVLIWRQQVLPPEKERKAALAALRADFFDLLDWDYASSLEGFALLTT